MSMEDKILGSGMHNSVSSGATGISTQPPSLLGSPIHSAPNLPTNSITLPSTPHFHKKSRKKRKELDALVPEEKIRRKSSLGSAGASCSFNGDSDDTEGGRLGLLPKSSSANSTNLGVWSFVPGVFAIVLVVGTAVMAMAALRLLMVTRRDMETLTRRLGSVEARSSELPARFHEAHVRLQALQRNTSALWDAAQAFRDALDTHASKVDKLQVEVSSLQSSVQASPLLSSVPQDVQALQVSVASFGSTLQDLQSALRAGKADQSTAHSDLQLVKAAVSALQEATTLPSEAGGGPVGAAVTALQRHLQALEASFQTALGNDTSWHTNLSGSIRQIKNQQESQDILVKNITEELHNRAPPSSSNDIVTTLRDDVKNISDEIHKLQRLNEAIDDLAQNVSVVKGVEKKLEGSQLQLASSVSSLKQQLLALQHSVSALTPLTTTTATPDNHPLTTAYSRQRRSADTAGNSDNEADLSAEYDLESEYHEYLEPEDQEYEGNLGIDEPTILEQETDMANNNEIDNGDSIRRGGMIINRNEVNGAFMNGNDNYRIGHLGNPETPVSMPATTEHETEVSRSSDAVIDKIPTSDAGTPN
ncbi:uncharacterized protein LOC108670316 [Hyalella azteca]|uniref:Uncharacterized protein LOC108670316 n=1 Tax=Hyalella azteca TaxID=294128 RepID=A0A8B7NHZ7_HYAAZ|nr:uncharacterized protein LOC108670316 [Hyalella azteca]